MYSSSGEKKHSIAVWKIFLHLLAQQKCYLDFNDLRVKDGGWKLEGAQHNHGQAIIICLHLLFYPLSPIDTANGIASLCHSMSHFCPPRLCLCWQSERMREEKREGKEQTEAFFNLAFCQFLCACQNEKQCPVPGMVGELLGRGWSLSVRKLVETSYWKGTPCCYKLVLQGRVDTASWRLPESDR